jgi:predicted ATPase
MAWAQREDDRPICWLKGSAGSGKSTIAQTIAQRCDESKRLAFSFFFSRRNRDRTDVTKNFPTFAYQLARFLPSINQPMGEVLVNDPAIFHQRLEDQFTKLIVNPVLSTISPVSPMIIVIDGLGEYDRNVPLVELIRLLVDALPRLPSDCPRARAPPAITTKNPITHRS